MCDRNLEEIYPDKIKKTENLLADVCMAAKYEGQSISLYYPQHKGTNPDSQLCTELARSFADIGDIIRGKDLFLGHKQGKQKLEEKLKQYFNNIYENLEDAAKKHYNGDKNNDFFQLREDWWALNRKDVWKAITCAADDNDKYSKYLRDGITTVSNEKCGHVDQDVPTNLDYVPQHLRWFHEWSEDFCRKKKKKLENLDTQCRGENDMGEPKYCSGDGYDCKGTFRAKNKYLWDHKCTGCFFSCSDFRKWIDNQKKEFLKQRNKYQTEISGNGRKRGHTRGTTNSNYEGYESKFYKELQRNGYQTVNAFLGLLSKEKACQAVNDEEGGRINFAEKHDDKSNEYKGTFYRSKYCQPCPLCGVEPIGGNVWKEKHESAQCKNIKLYKPRSGQHGTKIEILKSGEGHEDINKKLDAFCQTQSATGSGSSGGGAGGSASNSDSQKLYEEWKCYQPEELTKEGQEVLEEKDYQNVKAAGGLCILQKTNSEENVNKQKTSHEIQKTFNNFFNFWVAHVLKDSIEWRNKLKKCLENNNNQCLNK
ncbi:erythrocyte membrane protein 1 SD126B [Plasmodium falciparum RAJ116]|uniref:Erythrocyte membrane protein 1 SD126B n=1 Tax=Plasmodium falciparum RAJ116 TaxID=580058 RepID=A0A0L0CXG0_PLAFA|nr:erythrocyte membrane protein 1 SD126B [Plasmodium falciparum RAJ116]